ncbi:hypothetical protein Tco_1080933 [Tanacetum coccineum]|uniref:Uncharacterized protein n=1 Tax=Tanacetum coccineum TaxID=301880 RepID=A0ABQ5HW86_9ASTR
MFAICACARFQVTPKASHLNAVKRIFRYPKYQPKLGLWYPRDSPFKLEAFSDSDYLVANLDRKSTTGGCQFLGRRLISWQCKKQTIVANSTTKAEYVTPANCCGQVLWIQNQMMDYGFNFMNTRIYIDNESTKSVIKNPDTHSRTKHIEIRFHFFKDCYEKRLIEVIKIHTDSNVADLLTKGFDVTRFNFLVLKNVPVPLDRFPINALTSKVFFFMVKKGKHFLGNVIPLFESMLVQPTEDEGEAAEKQSEPQPTPSPPHPSADQHEIQPDPSPRPSPTTPIPDSIPEGSGGNHRGQSSSDRSLLGNKDGLTLQSVYDLCVSLCKQVTTQAAQIKDLMSQIKQLKKKAKHIITHHKAWMKSVSMKQRLARKKSLKKKVDAKGVCTNKPKVSTDKPEVSTAKPKEVEVCTDKLDEGTVKPKDGTSDESTTPTTVFRDDETIAAFLVSMSQNKAKQKVVEIKDAKDSDRPRATSTRSVLTLKPLPKIDPKDKGKKVLEEEAESDAESKELMKLKRQLELKLIDSKLQRLFSKRRERNFTVKMSPNSIMIQLACCKKEVPCSTKSCCNQKQTTNKNSAKKPNDDLSEACRRKEAC